MRVFRFIITVLFYLFIVSTFFASAKEDISLTVSGISSSKEAAITQALRSAIEQTYGAFVSSNTDILNDELVKDEIVTISQGCIKQYKELSCTTLTNGLVSVTLDVTVSLSHLVSYAQSKGASAELAGATFAENIRMYEFNKTNELSVISNLYSTLKGSSPGFDFKMNISDPTVTNYGGLRGYELTLTMSFYATPATDDFFSLY